MQIVELPSRLEHGAAATRDLAHQLRLHNVQVPPQLVNTGLHTRLLILGLGKSRKHARAVGSDETEERRRHVRAASAAFEGTTGAHG
jgi:hypothetical protein